MVNIISFLVQTASLHMAFPEVKVPIWPGIFVRIPATSYLVLLFTLIYSVLFHLLLPSYLDVPCYLNGPQFLNILN